MESLIDGKTKAILVNNPSNPCGSVLTKKNLQDVIRIAQKYQIPIIADEIYRNMVFKGKAMIIVCRRNANTHIVLFAICCLRNTRKSRENKFQAQK